MRSKYQILKEFLPGVAINSYVEAEYATTDEMVELKLYLKDGSQFSFNVRASYLNDHPEIFKPTDEGWRPNYGDEYWALNKDGFISHWTWEGSLVNQEVLAFGNCFPTREIAEKAREKVQALFKQLLEEYNEKEKSPYRPYHSSF